MRAALAHYDGQQIQLDDRLDIPQGAKFIVVVLDSSDGADLNATDMMAAQEPAFARVWDNEEDAIYDQYLKR